MLATLEIGNHPAGGTVSRGAGHTAAGVGEGAAQVKILDRGALLGRLGVGAQAEELVQVVAAVKDNTAVCNDLVLLLLNLSLAIVDL